MSPLTIFIGACVFVVLLLLVSNNVGYKELKKAGAIKGIILFVFVAFLVGFTMKKAFADDSEWKFANYFEVYAGIDKTFKTSPQCVREQGRDQYTSNGGFRLSLASYEKNRTQFSALAKYTHHSCAIGADRNSYDAPGLELTYRVYIFD